jgi:site-specific recombinase XerD
MGKRKLDSIVKTMAREIGLDPAGFSAHSLRAQVAQDLTQQGINNEAIMSVTGHHSQAGLRAYQQTSAT